MTVLTGDRLPSVLAAGVAALIGVTGAGVLSVAPASAAAQKPSPGSAGLGDRLYPTLGNGGYDVQNYDLSLDYARKDPAQQITGNVTITARAIQSLSRFDLDFAGDAVGAVTVDGRRAAFTRSGEELVITPSRPIRDRAVFTVVVSGFRATPVAPDADAPVGFVKTPDGTVLAGQPASSHNLFPSNDHPSDKATYTIKMTVPDGWTATANGTLVRTSESHGRESWVYREKNPMASELVQVAVGDFLQYSRGKVDGIPIRDVVPRRLAGTLLPRFANELEQMKWMESKVGKYPFENYGVVVIDGNLGFALETQTLSLFDTGSFPSDSAGLDPVLTHELAHQWFGDSVAPEVWSNVWQNEGHASYYEVHYAAEHGTLKTYVGFDTLEAYYKNRYARGDQYRATYGPVARPLKSDSIWDVFNPNVYSGGSVVLYALQQQVGDRKFAKIERDWVQQNRGKSKSTEDFIALASRDSGQDLRGFLNDWLYGSKTPPMPGHPDWTVTPVTPATTAAAAPAAPLTY
ncbi:M1 family metallopeptidase [Actinoplanes subtropicus]|uniref:M1 family metallopeptidase n=1 Tax=Actinoplanes subtropicus TaxID=543632 RepID=UPI0005507D1F|nr:M1 family metallopeptidase [Actinoplanes subtropicus]